MHPILADRGALALYLFVFLLIGFALAAFIAVNSAVSWSVSISFCVPMTLVYGLISLSSWYVCRSFPLKSTSPTRIIGVFTIAAIVSTALWLLLGAIVVSMLSSSPFIPTLTDRYTSQIILLSSTGVGLYLLSVAVHYLMITVEQSQETERRALELKILAQTAELRALQSQINPHFLFNSLNSISALTTKDPPAARAMTLMLSDFLRQTLKSGTADKIPLREEISLCKKYLDIEQIRFGPRLVFRQEIEKSAEQELVPPLLLQPLVENAVVHGIAHLLNGGSILLRADVRGDRLRIHVENPCDHDRPKTRGTKLGLENVRKRLQTLSDTDARLDVSELNGIFSADLTLPTVKR